MSDELTESVAATYEKSGTPMASKYLPYGALREVSSKSFVVLSVRIVC